MTVPLLSGFCNPGNPPESHRRCWLDGCTCTCHAAGAYYVDTAAGPMLTLGDESDGLVPAGYTPPLVPLEPVTLTAEERRQVIAGHLVLHPDTILETVRSILEARLTESTVTP